MSGLRETLEDAHYALTLARSVILSGEGMTVSVEEAIDAALNALNDASAALVVSGSCPACNHPDEHREDEGCQHPTAFMNMRDLSVVVCGCVQGTRIGVPVDDPDRHTARSNEAHIARDEQWRAAIARAQEAVDAHIQRWADSDSADDHAMARGAALADTALRSVLRLMTDDNGYELAVSS